MHNPTFSTLFEWKPQEPRNPVQPCWSKVPEHLKHSGRYNGIHVGNHKIQPQTPTQPCQKKKNAVFHRGQEKSPSAVCVSRGLPRDIPFQHSSSGINRALQFLTVTLLMAVCMNSVVTISSCTYYCPPHCCNFTKLHGHRATSKIPPKKRN